MMHYSKDEWRRFKEQQSITGYLDTKDYDSSLPSKSETPFQPSENATHWYKNGVNTFYSNHFKPTKIEFDKIDLLKKYEF